MQKQIPLLPFLRGKCVFLKKRVDIVAQQFYRLFRKLGRRAAGRRVLNVSIAIQHGGFLNDILIAVKQQVALVLNSEQGVIDILVVVWNIRQIDLSIFFSPPRTAVEDMTRRVHHIKGVVLF